MVRSFTVWFVLVVGLNFNVKAIANDPNKCFVSVYQDTKTNQWKLQLSFESEVLIKAMQIHFGDSALVLNPSMEFRNMAERFIQETVSIRINKHEQARLTNFHSVFDTHSSELIFDLKGVPDFIAYWESSIQCLANIPDPAHELFVMHRLQINKESDVLKLDYTTNFECKYLLMNDGKMRLVLN